METWKRSPLGPDHVEVSNLGRVRTLDRVAPSRRHKQESQLRAGKILSPWVSKVGYLTVSIKEGGKRPKYTVHRLVASAFCDGFEPGLSVNHIDGDKLNNHASNLEWVTLERNTGMTWETGQSTAEAHAQKLTIASVSDIKSRIRDGEPCAAIAKRYGVSDTMIYSIRSGRRWKSVA